MHFRLDGMLSKAIWALTSGKMMPRYREFRGTPRQSEMGVFGEPSTILISNGAHLHGPKCGLPGRSPKAGDHVVGVSSVRTQDNPQGVTLGHL